MYYILIRLEMLTVQDNRHTWDLTYCIDKYNKNIVYKSNLNTISIFRIIDDDEYWLHEEILLYLCSIQPQRTIVQNI